jgi:hypothetical protein
MDRCTHGAPPPWIWGWRGAAGQVAVVAGARGLACLWLGGLAGSMDRGKQRKRRRSDHLLFYWIYVL